MNILFLSRWFPYPYDNGSKIRVFQLLRALSSRHAVDLVSFSSEPLAVEQEEVMRRLCRRVEVVVPGQPAPSGFASLTRYLSRVPRSVLEDHSPEMEEAVREAAAASSPDVVIASQIDMAPYALLLPGLPRVLDEVELTVFWDQVAFSKDPLRRLRRKLMWAKRAAYTRRMLMGFDAWTVVSEAELAIARRVVPDRSPPEVVPNGAEMTPTSLIEPLPNPGSIIYAGSVTFAPNLEAVEYFIRDVLPRVQARVPEATFTVTGRNEGVSLGGLRHANGVHFAGFLSDIRKAVAQTWLSVAPILTGGGTRLKVLESLAVGTPVVSTPKGVEGLGLEDGRHVLIADDAATFAECVIRVLADSNLRKRLRDAGREVVARRYSWDRIGEAFCEVVERVPTGVG